MRCAVLCHPMLPSTTDHCSMPVPVPVHLGPGPAIRPRPPWNEGSQLRDRPRRNKVTSSSVPLYRIFCLSLSLTRGNEVGRLRSSTTFTPPPRPTILVLLFPSAPPSPPRPSTFPSFPPPSVPTYISVLFQPATSRYPPLLSLHPHPLPQGPTHPHRVVVPRTTSQQPLRSTQLARPPPN